MVTLTSPCASFFPGMGHSRKRLASGLDLGASVLFGAPTPPQASNFLPVPLRRMVHVHAIVGRASSSALSSPPGGTAPPLPAKSSSLINEYFSHLSGLIKTCASPLEIHKDTQRNPSSESELTHTRTLPNFANEPGDPVFPSAGLASVCFNCANLLLVNNIAAER